MYSLIHKLVVLRLTSICFMTMLMFLVFLKFNVSPRDPLYSLFASHLLFGYDNRRCRKFSQTHRIAFRAFFN